MLRRIAKSKMSSYSKKRGNPIVAHLTREGMTNPLCQASLAKKAHWCEEMDSDFKPERDCKNCISLAAQNELRELETEMDRRIMSVY